MNKVLKFAMGGFGRSSYGTHANWLKHNPGKFKIVGVADQTVERCQEAVNENVF